MSQTEIYPTTYLDLPTGDGQPMAETEAHGLEMTEFLRDILRDYYAHESKVYVASNNFVYYDPSDVRKSVYPDCYVIKGIEKRVRDSYQSWAEGGALPSLIFELTSHSTWRTDIDFKRDLYQSWACHEYFLYDLTADRILGHLLGFRLENGVYQEIPLTVQGRLFSEELQLELAHHGGHIRFFIPGAKQPIATRYETIQHQRRSTDQLEREWQRAESERQRAESERQRAESELAEQQNCAAQQRERAEQAEDELRRLKEELAKLRSKNGND